MEKLIFNLPDNLQSAIQSKNTIDGYIYDTLTSTNNQAWKLSEQQVESPFFVLAKQQTAGKGQRGNQWESLKGGLYLSLYFNLELSTEDIHHLTLFSVYGIVTQLQSHRIPVEIKWLNDLICQGKKLGGILSETRISNQKISQAVIGVGINYANATKDGAINIDELRNQHQDILTINSLNDLTKIVVLGLLNGYAQYQLMGIDFIINNYNQLLNNNNEKLLIEDNIGTIKGVNNKGGLKVKLSANNSATHICFPPENYSISSTKKAKDSYILTEK